MLNVRASWPSASPATMGLELTGPSAEMDCVAGSEISGVEDPPLTGTSCSCGPVGDWHSTMRLSASYQVSCVGPDTPLPMGTVGPRAAPPPGTREIAPIRSWAPLGPWTIMATRTPSGATRSWLTTDPARPSRSGTGLPLGGSIQTPPGPATHRSPWASQLSDVKRPPGATAIVFGCPRPAPASPGTLRADGGDPVT